MKEGGINSGFMIAQVTAAALASENKSLAHPGSVDSLPTSANQEDHVSMATYAARRLGAMCFNTAAVVGIEAMAAAQGIEFHRPLSSSPLLEKVFGDIRDRVAFLEKDHAGAGYRANAPLGLQRRLAGGDHEASAFISGIALLDSSL